VAEASWSDIAQDLATHCRGSGLDLAAPLQVGWYNGRVEPRLQLPDFGNPQSLAVLIGNTRILWPHLLDALRADPALFDEAEPVEAYTMRRVREAAGRLPVAHEIRWAHVVVPQPVAIQRLAQIAGLAHLAPSNLSVHPIHGPWIALRAVVVAGVPGPPNPPSVMNSPCDDCEHACLAAFRRAVAEPDDWRHWLQIRDACPIGRTYRYDESQIVYHYTKDRDALRRAVEERDDNRGSVPPFYQGT
jgi:methylmalonic aciduria homocystinuria type C protein